MSKQTKCHACGVKVPALPLLVGQGFILDKHRPPPGSKAPILDDGTVTGMCAGTGDRVRRV
jgi:hypothetical protein